MEIWEDGKYLVFPLVCLSEEKRKKMKGRKETTVKREKRDICEMSGGG